MTKQHTQSESNDVDMNVATYPGMPDQDSSESSSAPAPEAVTAGETEDKHTPTDAQASVEETQVNGAAYAPETASESAAQEQVPGASSSTPNEKSSINQSGAASEQPVRSFTDFIEEFRQSESRFQTGVGAYQLDVPASSTEVASIETEQQPEIAATPAGEPAAAKEPAVSPLLRPSSRLRLPRHGRVREVAPVAPVAQAQETPAPVETPSATEATSTPSEPSTPEPAPTVETPRPPRRYRFDRREPTANTTTAAATTPAPRTESVHPIEKEVAPSPAAKTPAAQAQPVIEEAPVTPVPEPAQATTPAQAETATSTEQPAEVSPEDLPPLEYSELQKASSRRRRRSKHNGSVSAPATPAASTTTPAPAPTPATPAPQTPVSRPSVTPPTAPASPHGVLSGYTVNQMNQGDGAGPFMGPDPSPARGSTVSQPGRASRTESQRAAPSSRSGDGAHVTISQLTNAITQAFQVQTDRMVAELRRSNQTPTNVTVSMPTLPSTERVGVFVDVANLLYSARTLRITIDFGKLLDFLRGNRRLVRAHAYTPTSPQPGDEQMFLQAVKGLGYRITTKNYKTFASGAKKADLDLDLCMDVVRLVDAKAVDSIVLVSGDSDFMPMLDYCSDHGVRVEVAAFDEAMSATLRQSCDLFINLAMLEEIRA